MALSELAHVVLNAQANANVNNVDTLRTALFNSFDSLPASLKLAVTSASSVVIARMLSGDTPTLYVLFGGNNSTPPNAGAMQGGASLNPVVANELYVALSPEGAPNADPWAATDISDDTNGIWPTNIRGSGWISCIASSRFSTGISDVEGLVADERILPMFKSSGAGYVPLDIGAMVAALHADGAESDERIYGVMRTPNLLLGDEVTQTTANVNLRWGRNAASGPANGTSYCLVFDPKNPAEMVGLFNPLALAPTYDSLAFADEDQRQSHLRLPLMRTSNGRIMGYWRQMGYGRKEVMLAEDELNAVVESRFLALSKTGGPHQGYWVDNFIDVP